MRGGGVQLIMRLFTGILAVVHTVLAGKALQFTVAASRAGKTFFIMRRKNQLKRIFSAAAERRCVGENLHAFADRLDAGCRKAARALHLYQTHPAGADLIDVF